LSLEGATTPGKRMILGYDTNSNGFGFIKAGNYQVTWTPLSLQPDGGNVGIGTTTPGYKLEVSGNSYFSGLAHFGQASGNGSAFRWGPFGTAVSDDTMLCMNQLWNGSGWTILNSGVGTTYLNLGGAVASPTIQFGTGPANTAATTKMIILNNGNVGIGTTAPDSLLHISGSGNTFARYTNTTSAGHYVDIGANSAGQSFVYGYGAYPLLFATNGSEAMRITSGGNVGIGTTSPGAKLSVDAGAGTPAFNNGISILTGNSTFTTGHGGILQFQNEDVITAAIRGVRESGWGSGMALYTHNTSSGNTFGTTVVERMRITEAGNVGIGTTAPPIKLYVGTVLTGTNGNGTYASDAIAVNSSESITIGPDRRADWGLDATTATSTTFQSKLNIWSDNEDHITFGGASTHLVSAW
jgi:hypothetical protein